MTSSSVLCGLTEASFLSRRLFSFAELDLEIINNAQCAFWVLRWPCGQNGPVYATGPYYVAHVVDTGP